MASSSLVALGGCVTCKFPAPGTVTNPISDGHAHFFNASDLPVSGFVRHVIAPVYAPNLSELVLAIADLFLWIGKTLAVSAEGEIARLGAGELFGSEAREPKSFADDVASYQEKLIRERGFVPGAERTPEKNLADSHLYLAMHLGAVRPGPSNRSDRAIYEAALSLDRPVYAEIAARGEDAAVARPAAWDGMVAGIARMLEIDARNFKSLFRWAFLMCLPRCKHVREYLATIRARDAQVGHASNLLVDFDKWLGDEPEAKSSHGMQVEFWTRYADRTASIDGMVRLHTFAGYDPLREVEEGRERPGAPTHFDAMKQWAADGRTPGSQARRRVAGFKLYPPMGFKPSGNSGMILPGDRAGGVVKARWHGRGWDVAELGKELDSALDGFFRHCSRNDIPIMSHARESNGAMSTSAAYASPHLWIDRVQEVANYGDGYHPLRLCLGHVDMWGADIYALRRILPLNAGPDPRARVYIDLSYDDDVLAGDPTSLLGNLRTLCTEFPHFEDFIVFGSDWIMLGQDAKAPDYLQTLRDAVAADTDFWAARADKLFRTNYLDFLGLGPDPR